MMTFVETPPAGMENSVRERILTLIRESLGDPKFYRSSIDKTMLPAAAEALGVRVPPFEIISDVDAARAFADANGYPVVLKRAFGTAGQAVEVVPEKMQLESAFRKLISKGDTTLWKSADLLVQAWIPGKGLLHAVAAWGARHVDCCPWVMNAFMCGFSDMP
jgi:phosphoribosylaminoimidazole carboxylase (NCAIR synthetase)